MTIKCEFGPGKVIPQPRTVIVNGKQMQLWLSAETEARLEQLAKNAEPGSFIVL